MTNQNLPKGGTVGRWSHLQEDVAKQRDLQSSPLQGGVTGIQENQQEDSLLLQLGMREILARHHPVYPPSTKESLPAPQGEIIIVLPVPTEEITLPPLPEKGDIVNLQPIPHLDTACPEEGSAPPPQGGVDIPLSHQPPEITTHVLVAPVGMGGGAISLHHQGGTAPDITRGVTTEGSLSPLFLLPLDIEVNDHHHLRHVRVLHASPPGGIKGEEITAEERGLCHVIVIIAERRKGGGEDSLQRGMGVAEPGTAGAIPPGLQ